MRSEAIRGFMNTYREECKAAKPCIAAEFPKEDYYLDTPELDSPEFFAHIANFLPLDAFNIFKQTCVFLNTKMRPKAAVAFILLGNNMNAPIRFFDIEGEELEDPKGMLAKFDIECKFLLASGRSESELFSQFSPSSLIVQIYLCCQNIQPGIMPFLNRHIEDVTLGYDRGNLTLSYPFGLQDVLDRIDGAEMVSLPVCQFTDSANWKEIILQWVKRKRNFVRLTLKITSDFAQAELDDFLKRFLPHVRKCRFVGIGLAWSTTDLEALKNEYKYAQNSYVVFGPVTL